MALWNTAIPLVLLLIVPLSAYGAETITGQDSDSKIAITLQDGRLASYVIETGSGSGKTTIEASSPSLKERSYGFVIADWDSGVFISVRNTDGGYVIDSKVRLGSEIHSKTYVSDGTKEQPAIPADSVSIYETPLQEAQRLRDEAVKKIEEQNKDPGKPKDPNILLTYDEYKKKYLTPIDDDADVQEVAVEEETDDTRLFVYVPTQVQWRTALKYNVMVTDDAKLNYRPEFVASVGNPIEGVKLKSVVRDTAGNVIHEAEGKTVSDGSWTENGYVVPDNSVSNKPHSIEVVATRTVEGSEEEAKSTVEFYAVLIKDTTNHAPNASATIMPMPIMFESEGAIVKDEIVDKLKVNPDLMPKLSLSSSFPNSTDSTYMFVMGGSLDITMISGEKIKNGTGDRLFLPVDSVDVNTMMKLLRLSGSTIVGPSNYEFDQLIDTSHGNYNGGFYNFTGGSLDKLFMDPLDPSLLWEFGTNTQMIMLDASESSDRNKDKIISYEWIIAGTAISDVPKPNSEIITCDRENNDSNPLRIGDPDITIKTAMCEKMPDPENSETKGEYHKLTLAVDRNHKYADKDFCIALTVTDHHLLSSKTVPFPCVDFEFTDVPGYYQ